MTPTEGNTFALHTIKWRHTLTLHLFMLLCNWITRETKNLVLDGAIFCLGPEISLKLNFSQQAIPSSWSCQIPSLPSPQLQGRQVIYAGRAFILWIIAQGQGDATDVIKISSATFAFAAVLLLAPFSFLLSQDKRHLMAWLPWKQGAVLTLYSHYS